MARGFSKDPQAPALCRVPSGLQGRGAQGGRGGASMVGPGGSLFKRTAAPSSWLPPDSDVQRDLPSWLSPLWWLPSLGSKRPITRDIPGDLMLSCLGFRCVSSLCRSEKLRSSPRDRLFCVNRGKERCGSGSLSLSSSWGHWRPGGSGPGAQVRAHFKDGEGRGAEPAVVASLGPGRAGPHRRVSSAAASPGCAASPGNG